MVKQRASAVVLAALLILALIGGTAAHATTNPNKLNIEPLITNKQVLPQDVTDGVDAVTVLGDDPLIGGIVNNINKQEDITKTEILSYTRGEGGLLTFSNKKYNDMSLDKRQEWMRYALKSVQQSDLNARTKSKMYNFIADQDGAVSGIIRQLDTDTGADVARAGGWYKTIVGPINAILGVIVIFLVAMVVLVTVMDLSILAIPPLQNLVMVGVDSTGKRPFFFSQDAYITLQKHADDSSVKILWSYATKRFWAVTLLLIVIALIVSGKVWSVMGWLTTALTGGTI